MEFGWFRKSNQVSLFAMQVVLPAFVFLFAVSALILFLGYRFHSNHVRQQQLLSYIEFERISDSISKSWESMATASLRDTSQVSMLRWTEAGVFPVSGTVTELTDWEQIKPKKILTSPFIIQLLGKPYVVQMEPEAAIDKIPSEGPFAVNVRLTPFDISQLIQLTRVPLESSIVYLVSKEGQLIFSTSSLINHKNFISRPVVQKFVLNQVNASGLGFTDYDGKKGFGYSFFIPGSNIVMFAEISAEAHEQGFSSTFKQALIVTLSASFIVGLLLWIVHRRVYKHLRELALGMERSSLIPATSQMSESKITELAFLKSSWQQSERKLQYLYQKVNEQKESGNANVSAEGGTHDPKKSA